MKRLRFLFAIIALLSTINISTQAHVILQKERISILRFDKDLFDYLKQPDADKGQALKNKYPTLLPAFAQIVTSQGETKASDILVGISKYFSHPALLSVYTDALAKYSDVATLENRIAEIQSLLSDQYPQKQLPQLAMHVSGFKENVIVLDKCISISIDKYLGEDYTIYKDFFTTYQRREMTSKALLRDYLKVWIISDVIKDSDKTSTLLDAMIKEGKILYMLSQLLPEYSEAELMGYTDHQMNWSHEHEKNIWRNIVKQNHLYSKDFILISKYISDDQYTTPLTKDSPGRIANWIGMQIVSQYAKNKNVSLQEILTANVSTIFKESKYKP